MDIPGLNFILGKLSGPTLEMLGKKLGEVLDITPTKKLYSKIFRIFEAHEIKRTQIPLVIPDEFQISFQDIEDRISFQQKISQGFLTWLVGYFNINPDWLHDDNAHIYNELCVYKSSIRHYVDLLIEKQKEETYSGLIILKPKGEFDSHTRVKPLLIEYREIGNVEIPRLTVFRDLWKWNEGGGHQLRLMIRMFFAMKGLGAIHGYSTPQLALEDFNNGKKFLSELKIIPKGYWSPDVFAFCENERSEIAKDAKRMSKIIEWGKQKGIVKYFEEKTGLSIDDDPLMKK